MEWKYGVIYFSDNQFNFCGVTYFLRQLSYNLNRVKRIWYLSPMRAAKVQASLRICAVSPDPLLLVHTSNESRGTFSQKARSLAPLNGWACAVKIFHDRMLEDTNSLDAAHLKFVILPMILSMRLKQYGITYFLSQRSIIHERFLTMRMEVRYYLLSKTSII